MVARVPRYEASVTTQPSQVVAVRAPQTSAGALGEGMEQLGQGFLAAEESIATAHAYQVDAEFIDFLRVTMDGDGEGQDGYLSTQYGDAVAGRDGVIAAVEARFKDLLGSLNPIVRTATGRSMESRYQSFLSAVNSHAETQARAGVAAAGRRRDDAVREAGIRAALLGDAEGWQQAMDTVAATAADVYGEGTPEATEYIREHSSDSLRAVMQGLNEEQGADAAWSFAEENEDMLTTGDLWDVAEAYRGPAMQERGRAAADQAAQDVLLGFAEQFVPEPTAPRPELYDTPLSDVPDISYGGSPSETGFVDVVIPGAYETAMPPGATVRDVNIGMSVAEAAAEDPDVLDPRQERARPGPDLSPLQHYADTYAATVQLRAEMQGQEVRDAYALMAQPATTLSYGEAGTMPLRGRPTPRPLRLPGDVYVPLPDLIEPDWAAARSALMEIENPLARQAALEQLEARREEHVASMRQVHEEALRSAQEFIIANGGAPGTVGRISPEILRHLTPAEYENLHAFRRTVFSNRDGYTPIDVRANAEYLVRIGDGNALMAFISENRHQMSVTDYEGYAVTATGLIAGDVTRVDDITWSTVDTAITRAMGNFGLSAGDNPSTRRLLDAEISTWVRSTVQTTGREPSRDEIRDRATQLLQIEISVDGSLRLNTGYEGSAYGIDLDGSVTGGGEFSYERFARAARRGQFTIAGRDVTEAGLNSVVQAMTDAAGQPPTPDELYRGLVAAYGGIYANE